MKIALFADDVLFLKDPMKALPKLKKTLEEFGSLSGIKINFEKSEILPLNSNRNSNKWQQLIKFPIAPTHIKYLGILIGKSPSSIYNLNFPPTFDKIRKDLQGWRNLPLSLCGRANLYRMNSFAKILYPLQTIPVMIPTKDIDKLNKSLRVFLWRG